MGLAASQARFLGITLRKANCEFKSTELAQQKLELTNQMTDISQEYSNALNATKLVWHNEMVCDSFGNPMDMGLSYGLLMMPSVANDFNPYMVSSRSGAIILNAKFADAARLAGISMGGGIPSEEGRNKFIKALANQLVFADSNDAYAKGDENNNIITNNTCNVLVEAKDTHGNLIAPASNGADVKWHSSAGMGAVPKDKGAASVTTLNDIIDDSNIGRMSVDWLQIGRGLMDLEYNEALTETQLADIRRGYIDNIAYAKLDYLNNDANISIDNSTLNDIVLYATSAATSIMDVRKNVTSSNLEDFRNYCNNNSNSLGSLQYADPYDSSTVYNMSNDYKLEILAHMAYLDAQIENATNTSQKSQYIKELENYKRGLDYTGNPITLSASSVDSAKLEYENPIYWAVYEKIKNDVIAGGNTICWSDNVNASSYGTRVDISTLFQTNKSEITTGEVHIGNNYLDKLTLVQNDVICTDKTEIKDLSVADLLTNNIVIMATGTAGSGNDKIDAIGSLSKAGEYIMEYVASLFGYGHIGTGLNVDETSDQALYLALEMVKKKFLKSGNAVKSGNSKSNSAVRSNSAYLNANDYNRIGATEDGSYAALNLSNMVSAFLTYYDNFLRGSESGYIVGKGNTDGKTVFVTDDAGYAYVMNTPEEISNDEKVADFYNQLYNNICEHGWRYDDMVIDNEYLESAVKDGRYQIMSLNSDGYFYQERYNNLPYMEEVKDQDAIARAEASFTTKKAQITYKEDQIDIKTKKLDAEISELNTEINSVQNIISKTIEKTFSLFSN